MIILFFIGLVHGIESKTNELELLNYHLIDIIFNSPDLMHDLIELILD